MGAGRDIGRVPGLVAHLWGWLRQPSTRIPLGAALAAGLVGGMLFWGGLHWAVELSNTEAFCISCHEMRDNPYKEMEKSIHFVNRTGARAICSDCHVPHQWVYKMARKIYATKDVFFHLTGKIDTPEKFEAHRLGMALSVWRSMTASDSRECRNCHQKVWMDMSAQWGGAQHAHQVAVENGHLTCIDCHQGVAHNLPQGFKRPTTEQLVKDAKGWLQEMEALNAAVK